MSYKRIFYSIIIAIMCLSAFGLFSVWMYRGGMKQIDFDVTVKIQERVDSSTRLRTAHIIGEVMEGSTFFGSPLFTSAVVMTLSLIACLREKTRKRWVLLLGIPMLFSLLVSIEILAKNVVHHPSPPYFMIKNPTTIFPKYYINEQYSYPSGHAARAVFISVVLASLLIIPHTVYTLTKRNYLVIACLIVYATLVGFSRIYLGHHWLSDIIGGSLLGFGFGLLTLALNSLIIDKQ